MSNLLGPPTVAGYTTFLRGVGISAVLLPDNSFSIQLSLAISQDIVTQWLQWIDCDIYTLAVYNLATDRLIHFAQDQPGQTFFADMRGKDGFNTNAFVAGVIESSADESTSQSFAVPDSLKNLTLMDLSNLQTPYGREYLAFAQMIGTLWGLT